MSGSWSFILTDAGGNALAELSTASGRTVAFKRNSYAEVGLTISHEDDAASLLLGALANTGVPRLKAYRRGPNDSSSTLRFRGPLMGLQEVSEESSLLTATFRSPFSVLMGDGDKTGRFIQDAYGTYYSAVDAGLIAENLIDIANRDAPTGLGTDPSRVIATKARDRSYPQSQNIGSAVTDLTAVLDGFDFYETFVENTTTVTAALGGPTNLRKGMTDPGTPTWAGATGTIYWQVTAVIGGVESKASNELSLALVHGVSDSPKLAWDAVSGATSYNVYRATVSGGEATSPALVLSGVTTLTMEDLGTLAVSAGAVPPGSSAPWQVEAFFNVTPSLGSVNGGARFEYGPNTLSNVQHMERITTPPQNTILVTGGNGLSSIYSDTTSVAKYGKWWGRADFSDIIEQVTLDDKARGLCRPAPVKTITFVPELGMDNCPKPWDEWALGDTVSLYASRGALSENTQLRINGFSLAIDESGLETVSVDDPQSPEEDAVLMTSLEAEVLAE